MSYGVIATFSTPSRRFAEEVVGCGDVAERERVSDEGGADRSGRISHVWSAAVADKGGRTRSGQPINVSPYRATSSGTQSIEICEPYCAAVAPIV